MLYIVLLYHTIFYYSVFYYNSLNTAIIYSITIHLQLFTYIPIYIYYSGLIISITGWFFLEEELVLSPAPWPSWSCCRTEENTSRKSSCFTGARSAGEIPFWTKKRGPLSGEKNFGAKIRRGKSQEELRFCGYEWLGNGTQVPQKHEDWWGIGINLGFYEPYGDVQRLLKIIEIKWAGRIWMTITGMNDFFDTNDFNARHKSDKWHEWNENNGQWMNWMNELIDWLNEWMHERMNVLNAHSEMKWKRTWMQSMHDCMTDNDWH